MIQITGSDTMLQLTQKLSTKYIQKYPKKNIALQGGGSGRGIATLINNLTDIANASRKIKPQEINIFKERNHKVYEIPIARDGVVIIVNPKNPLNSLTIEQISLIYQNKITNWSFLDPSSTENILVVARDHNSGTHEYFKKSVIKQGIKDSLQQYGPHVTYAVSSQQILNQISQNPKAIGYIGIGWINKKIKVLSILKNNKLLFPSLENVENGKYPLSRPLYTYTLQKTYSKVEPFINFIFSEQGSQIIKDLGFVPISKEIQSF